MSEWLTIPWDQPSTSTFASPPDAILNIVLSPYDVPDAVRAYETSRNKLRIEFRYIDGPEPEKTIRLDELTIAVEGKHSGRLIALEIDLTKLGATSLGVAISTPMLVPNLDQELTNAWDRILDKLSSKHNARGRDLAVRRAFDSRKADILQQLGASP